MSELELQDRVAAEARALSVAISQCRMGGEIVHYDDTTRLTIRVRIDLGYKCFHIKVSYV